MSLHQRPIAPTPDSSLIEPSFEDVIARISTDAAAPAGKRTHWACALRKVAEAMGKPLEAIPARWSAIRQPVGRLHHASLGVEAKTLRNHIANLKAALAWFGEETDLPARGAPLSAAWSALYRAVEPALDKKALISFMRFCSATGVEPGAVNDVVVDRFFGYRAEHTALPIGRGARRALARSWNRCHGIVPGWPDHQLDEPELPRQGLRLEDLPAGLRRDLEDYLARLATVRRNVRGKRLRPCKPSTIHTRRAELLAYLGKVVECGFGLETITTLSEALKPDVVERVIDGYWQENGPSPTVYTIDLAWKLLVLARTDGRLSAADLERLDEIRESLEEYRTPGLTPKNRAVIRQVLVDGVWASVVALPQQLMAEGERRHNQSPVRAAVLAGVAVAIAILTFAPIRVGNLAVIRLGENLIRPNGPSGRYWLVFPDYDVKNRVPLEFELNGETTAIIDRYLTLFRRSLVRGSANLWLFPGEGQGHKGPVTLSGQITDQVFSRTGLRLTAHQFRHAAAAIYLRHRPGEYELVRRLLGHRSIVTTMNAYVGLETIESNRIFGDIIAAEVQQGRNPPKLERGRQSRRPARSDASR